MAPGYNAAYWIFKKDMAEKRYLKSSLGESKKTTKHKMPKYFIDTEFHEHKKPVKFLGITIAKVWTIDLISIGITCEDGRSYYAINRDLNLKHARKHKWLKANVLSQLPIKQPLYPTHGSPRIYQETMRWLPLVQIRQEVIDFCGGKPEFDESGTFYAYPNGKPEFYAYFADYDWVVFAWLFGTMMDLPNGFPNYCKDLKQMLDEKLDNIPVMWSETCPGPQIQWLKPDKDREATLDEKLIWMEKLPNYPIQKNEHNALADAKWNLELFRFLKTLNNGTLSPSVATSQDSDIEA